jgi:glycosyltransferase involved in cell wall biosynthesis
MKIAFVSTMEGSPWGGSEELWSRTASVLVRHGHEVSANVIRWRKDAPQISALREVGVIVSNRPSGRSRFQRLLKRFLPGASHRWLARVKPELLIISQGGNLDGVEWMLKAAELQIPYMTIAQMADETYWPPVEITEPAAKAYRQARQCFFVSQGNLELTEMQIATRLPQGSVVRNPVNIPADLDLPLPWPAENDGVFRLAVVGRLAPAAKGQDILLQVLAMPKWRERPIEVSFYGEGYFKATLERLLKMMDLPKARLAGHASRIDEIWKKNHALLLPSRHEGLPLALVEAMLCGRPGIVTDVAGNAEMITDNETGFIAAAAKAACLDEAMERAWHKRDQWRLIGLDAASRIKELLPPDPIADLIQRMKIPPAKTTAQNFTASKNPGMAIAGDHMKSTPGLG